MCNRCLAGIGLIQCSQLFTCCREFNPSLSLNSSCLICFDVKILQVCGLLTCPWLRNLKLFTCKDFELFLSKFSLHLSIFPFISYNKNRILRSIKLKNIKDFPCFYVNLKINKFSLKRKKHGECSREFSRLFLIFYQLFGQFLQVNS